MSEPPETHEPPAPPGYSPDTLPLKTIGAWVVGLAVLLALVVVGLYQLFLHTARGEVQTKQLAPVSPELLRQRDRDAALLGRYEVADERRGRYRIPIGRAMEVLAADPALLTYAGAPASAPTAPAAPAAASAPPAGPR